MAKTNISSCKTEQICVRRVTCIRVCIQKFPYWLPGARTANGTALWH